MVDQSIKVAVDAVVFGYSNNELKILLIQQKYGETKDQWALPGGFVKDSEGLDEAVKRELCEETGVKATYLEQLYTFGNPKRDSRFRVVSIAYIALINPKNSQLEASTDAKDAQWFDVKSLPKLAYDHQTIISVGLERLKAKINYQPIGFDLLATYFPFSDLENLYQTILDKKIDRRNFRKKILSFNILEETDKISQAGSGRPAKLFKFNLTNYKRLEKQGFHFEIKLV